MKQTIEQKTIETLKKALKTKVAIVAAYILAPYLLVLFILTIMPGNDSSSTMFATQKTEGFLNAFKESINVSTRTDYNFCEILAAYVLNSGDIEKYDVQVMKEIEDYCKTGGSIQKFVKNKNDYGYLVETYKNSYQELISSKKTGSKIDYYYNCYFPIAYEIRRKPPPPPPSTSTPVTTSAASSPSGSSKPQSTPQPPPPPPPPPIPVNVVYSDDFLDPRDYGDEKYHYGTDIMCPEGSPIICVESGSIETIGWNSAGGWRIGIRSQDGNRFWYYAHLRKVHPYLKTLRKGDTVTGGQLLGYVGSSGYSDDLKSNTMPDPVTLTNPLAVDKKFVDHLHFGLQVKYPNGESKEQWVNPYPVLELLKLNKVAVNEPEDYTVVTRTLEERTFATLQK